MDSQKQYEPRNPYAKKYMSDKNRIVLKDNTIKKVRQLKKDKKLRSDNETIEYLYDIEKKVDPMFEHKYTCKLCNKEVENIPEGFNIKKFIHSDLCTDKSCKGYITEEYDIAIDPRDGVIISKKDTKRITELRLNKDKRNGTTGANDKKEEEHELSDEEIRKNEETEFPFDPKVIDRKTWEYIIESNIKGTKELRKNKENDSLEQ